MNSQTATAPAAAPAPPLSSPATASTRLTSLDALRGFDMFWIVGGTHILRATLADAQHPWLVALYEQFFHVEWVGFTFYDLIFPLFLFMIGVAIPFSFAKRIGRGDAGLSLHAHIFIRGAILIVLGMMVNGNLLTYDPERFQITYSVLQVLAIGYMIAALLYLHTRLLTQLIVTAAMLIGYWLLMAFAPVPGHEVGVYRPGALAGDYLNDLLLGDWQGRWTNGWTLASLGYGSTAMMGVFAGQLLRSSLSELWKTLTLFALGLGCLGAGLFWSGWVAMQWPGLTLFGTAWEDWVVWFPIIKLRWTSTYVLYAAGWSFLLLGLFYMVIDVWKFRRGWTFFIVIGANSIFAYMCWHIARGVFRGTGEVFVGGLEQHLDDSLYQPIMWTAAMLSLWLLLWYLYRNRTFIRV